MIERSDVDAGRSEEETVRILFLNHTGNVSGAEYSLFHLVQALVRQMGWDVTVAAPERGRLESLIQRSGAAFRLLPIHQPSRSILQNVSNLRTLRAFVRERRIDLVHANSYHTAKAIVSFTMTSRVPVVASVRDIEPFPRLTSRALAACSATVCVSEATAANLRPRFPRRRRERLRVIYNAVDTRLYGEPVDRQEVLSRLGVDRAEAPVAIMLGPVVRWKGQDLFLEAARHLVRECGGGTFLVVGHEDFAEPAYKERLHEMARLPELDGRVVFTGFREDVPEILGASDFAVCPSRHPDPLPRAVIEAMGAGLPVIGARIGGIPEAIEDGRTGYLVPVEDPMALANAMAKLVREPDRARTMGRRGREIVRERFSVEVHLRKMTALYRTLLDRHETI